MNYNIYEYRRALRELNTKLGLIVLALTILPVLLLGLNVHPVVLLIVTLFLGLGIGIVYPLWWRSRNHPDRISDRERHTVRILYICRPLSVVLAVASMVGWELRNDSPIGPYVAFLCGAACVAALIISNRASRYAADRKPTDS